MRNKQEKDKHLECIRSILFSTKFESYAVRGLYSNTPNNIKKTRSLQDYVVSTFIILVTCPC